jgi:hypothetical protein
MSYRYLFIILLVFVAINFNYAITCGNIPSVGATVTGCRYINISNSQLVSTPTGFEQEITDLSFNAMTGNYFIYNSISSALVPVWIENSTIDWIQLNANTISAMSTVNEVYAIGFCTSCNFLLSGNDIGEAPELSSSYAQYDNGYSVFIQFYNNLSSSTNWYNYGTCASTTFSSGLTLALNGHWCGVAYGSGLSSVNDYIEASAMKTGGDGFVQTVIGTYSEVFGISNAGYPISGQFMLSQASGYGNGNSGSSINVGSVANGQFYTISGQANATDQRLFSSYTLLTSSTSQSANSDNIQIEAQDAVGGSSTTYWIRERVYPPAGVMPSTEYTGVIPILTPSTQPILIITTNPIQFGYLDLIKAYVKNNHNIELTINSIVVVSASSNTINYLAYDNLTPLAIGNYIVNAIDPSSGDYNSMLLEVLQPSNSGNESINKYYIGTGASSDNYDGILVLLAGIGFLFLYSREEVKDGFDIVYKYLWLFVGIILIILSFFANTVLTSSTVNNVNQTVTYIYTPDNSIIGIGNGVAYVWVVLIVLLVWKLVTTIQTKRVG